MSVANASFESATLEKPLTELCTAQKRRERGRATKPIVIYEPAPVDLTNPDAHLPPPRAQ